MQPNSSRWWLIAALAVALTACADGANDPPGGGGDALIDMGDEADVLDTVDMSIDPDTGPTPDMAPDPDGGCVPAEETCNGADDDCDGVVDNGFEGLGEACEAGVGACAAAGTIVCSEDGSAAVCDAVAGDPGEETCNAIDDDCDGEIDNGIEGLGESCQAGEGECVADGTVVCAEDGSTTCDATPGAPGDELCNGLDDDCDGTIDNDVGGAPCETGEPGACGAGVLTCEDGGPVCVPAVGPAAEICDGIDNDCNGEVDDGLGLGEACSAGLGACAADGVTVCGPEGAVVCDAVPGQPFPELCDGTDSDCDGEIDNVPGTGEPCFEGIGSCRTEGVIACGPNGLACNAVPGEPGEEVCDGADNDCNDVIDDVAGLGEDCTVGIGGCAVDGITVCGPNGVQCDAEPGEPLPEACDGTDNDCNGAIDDAPECGAEVCDNGADDDGDGQVDCDDADCANALNCLPPEACDNGQDDDGDGQTDCDDADCADDPACAPPPAEDCTNGVDDDGDGQVDCDDADCGVDPACIPPPAEDCANGADDDGDGQVDCDDADCAAFPGCVPPDPELCDNGQDDDGDGQVDCDDADCNADPACIPPPVEDCSNGQDDDGDGQVDCDDADCANDPICLPPPPEDCDNGADDDRDGQIDCADADCVNDPFCVVDPEVCDNGQDDDGDGQVDCDDPDCAGFPGCVPPDPELCDNGQDDDGDGQVDCDDADCAGDPACVPPPAEVCDNGADDDGDGQVDCADADCAADAACQPDEATPIAEPGEAIELAGVIDEGSPVFDRPGTNCGAVTADRRFRAYRIVNETGADQVIDLNAEWNAGDGYLIVYRAPFDPAASLDNCLDANDDDPNEEFSALDGVDIAAGEELVVVASTFAADADVGPFSITISTRIPPEVCDNGIDDDTDGLADCDDDDCAGFPACQALEPTPIADPGGSVALAGRLDDQSPVFDRPGEDCVGAEVGRRYQTFTIVNETGDDQVINARAEWIAGDGFLLVYRAPFDPAAPLDGCIAGDDDAPVIAFSEVTDVAIAAGEQLVVVATTFGINVDLGPFTITVTTQVPAVPEVCDNGADDDGDGQIDCDDADCAAFPGCVPPDEPTPIAPVGETLDLGGVLDADSPTYNRQTSGCAEVDRPDRRYQVLRVVNQTGAAQLLQITARWNAGDGLLFAYTDPFDPAAPAAGCLDGNDDFGGIAGSQITDVPIGPGQIVAIVATSFDANADIGPFDIEVLTVAAPQPEICDSGVDDDGDGDIDCADADCVDFPACIPPEVCDSGIDEDGDGDIDCADADCAAFPGCLPEVCDNGIDDNGDGAIDCADAGCVAFPGCEPDDCPVVTFDDGVLPADFTLGGDADWFVDGDAPSSGVIGANQTSSLEVAVSTPAGGQVTFDYRVSSEDRFDFLRFYVDGAEVGAWSGEVDWTPAAFDLAPGDHVLQWVYEKDVNTDTGEDRGQIDNVLVTGAAQCIGGGGNVPAAPIAAPGQSIALDGQLDADSPVFNRQTNGCGASNTPDRRYQTFSIVNQTGLPQSLTVTGTWNEGDGYLFVYRAPFDPAAPENGCLAGDDDFNGVADSQVTGVPIAPGEVLVIVASSFAANADIGPFDIEVLTEIPPGLPIAAPGQSIALQGQLDGDSPVFNRPTGDCNAADNPDRRYQTFTVVNDTGADQSLTVTGVWNAGDGYVFAYTAPFDPAAPDAGCVAGNDDSNGTAESQVTDVPIAAGAQLVIVVSTWGANADLGPYDLTILTQ